MYKLLLVLASAQALKRPQRALAVRGGEVDPITIGKGIVAASGIYGAFDPAANAGLYGIKAEDKGNAMMRLAGWSQILFAAALNLDTESVHGQMCYHGLAFLPTRCRPSRLQAPKAPDALWMAINAAIGHTPRRHPQQVDRDVPLVCERRLILPRAQSAIDLYEMKGTNRLCKAMTGLMGGQMLCVGTYRGASWRMRRLARSPTPWPFHGLAAAKFALPGRGRPQVPEGRRPPRLLAGLAYKALN